MTKVTKYSTVFTNGSGQVTPDQSLVPTTTVAYGSPWSLQNWNSSQPIYEGPFPPKNYINYDYICNNFDTWSAYFSGSYNIVLSEGSDLVLLGAGNDQVIVKNDVWTRWGGYDVIYGGGGNNKLIFLNSGAITDFEITSGSDSSGAYVLISLKGETGSIKAYDFQSFRFGGVLFDYSKLLQADKVAPVLLSVSPGRDAAHVDVASNISLTFSESIQRGSGNIILKKADGTIIATYGASSPDVSISGSTLTINPSEDLNFSTGYVVEVGAGAVKDDWANNNASADTFSFTTDAQLADNIGPTAVAYIPLDESTAVPVNSNIYIKFNEPIQLGVGPITLKTATGSTVAVYEQGSANLSVLDYTLCIDPSANLDYSTGYKVDLAPGSVKDVFGNDFAGTATYNFTTIAGVDSTSPTVKVFSPADESSNVAVSANIEITFSENIQRGAGSIVLKKSNGTVVATYGQNSSNVTIFRSVLTINPSSDLSTDTDYKVEMAYGAVKDYAGNSYEGTLDYNFATKDTRAPTLTDYSPILNATNVDVETKILVKFSENIVLGDGFIVLRKYGGEDVEAYNSSSSNLKIDGDTLEITPSKKLEFSTQYVLAVYTNAVKDIYGNNFIASNNWQVYEFRTSKEPTVLPPNVAPVATSSAISTTEDTVKNGTLTATDTDSTSLTYIGVVGPSHGTILWGTGGNYTYTPDSNFGGSDSFTFKANDGALDSNIATISITVNPINDAPVGNIAITGVAKSGETLIATKNFTDADGVPVWGQLFKSTWVADNAPISGGNVAVNQAGEFISSSLVVTSDLVGKKISFSVNYTDNGGTSETVMSSQTAAVTSVANNSFPGAKFWKDTTKTPIDTKKADAVNLTDAIAILKMIVGLNVNSNNTPLSPYQAIAADFDQSGDVGLTDAIGVLKMVVGLSAPTPTWKYYDDTKLASTYTLAQSLNPKGWTSTAALSDTGAADASVKLVGVLTGDVDGSWTGV